MCAAVVLLAGASPPPTYPRVLSSGPAPAPQLVSTRELAALADAFAISISAPTLTNKFLEVVEEESTPRAPKHAAERPAGAGAEVDPEADALAAAYQKLFALALLHTVRRALDTSPPESAAEMLAGVSLPPPQEEGTGDSATDAAASLEPKLLRLACSLAYHKVSAGTVWKDGSVLAAAEGCLASIRAHGRFLQLLPAAGAVCSLVHDRLASCPAEYDACMTALISALGVSSASFGAARGQLDAGDCAATMLLLGTGASLAQRLPSGAARKRLWVHTREVFLPAAAKLLERCEAQRAKRARSGGTARAGVVEEEEERHAVATTSVLVEFFLLSAPPAEARAPAQLKDALVASGVMRSVVLSFAAAGAEPAAEPLRRAVLACCASSAGLRAWAHAVPGFAAAWEQPGFQPGGACQLHGALHGCLAGQPGADEALACLIQELAGGGVDGVPELHAALRTLTVVHEAGGGAPAWGPAAEGALQAASTQLRATMTAAATEGSEEAQGGDEGDEEEDAGAAEERKMRRGAAAQAVLLAGRQAARLHPECLRMVKALAAKPGSLGKAD